MAIEPYILQASAKGDVGQIGTIDVDVTCGGLCATPDAIAAIETHAHSLAQRTP